MQKKIIKAEIGGILFVIAFSVFLQNLHSLCNRELIGIIFGSVNDSIWEICKTLLMPYLAWSMIELLTFRPQFKKFVVSKIISLYFLAISYIILCLIFSNADYMLKFTFSIACISTASFMSFKLLFSALKTEILFYPAFFMLLLFIALYCSFTPFPPKCSIFIDKTTSLYGIIPEHIDKGAIVLDTIYYA